jgi:chromosome partitioning protein
MAKKFAVMMYKGGSGKSTTATNLGAVLVDMGQRVLLVDLDRQGNATTGVGFELGAVPKSVNHLFADADLHPKDAIIQTDFGLHVLAASRDLAKTAMNMSPGDMFLLRELLGRLDDDYDIILIDTPPNEGYMTYSALAAADAIIIPVATRGFSEEGLTQTIDGITAARKTYNPNLKLAGILFTNVEKGTIVASQVLKSVQEDHADAVFPHAIPKASLLDKGNAAGIPGVLLEPKHKAAEAYRNVARILIDGNQ